MIVVRGLAANDPGYVCSCCAYSSKQFAWLAVPQARTNGFRFDKKLLDVSVSNKNRLPIYSYNSGCCCFANQTIASEIVCEMLVSSFLWKGVLKTGGYLVNQRGEGTERWKVFYSRFFAYPIRACLNNSIKSFHDLFRCILSIPSVRRVLVAWAHVRVNKNKLSDFSLISALRRVSIAMDW